MFASIQTAVLPTGALLDHYARIEGGFTDCYVTEVPGTVCLADYVAAFYTTPLFRLERWVLAVAARKPSTDAEAVDLGAGHCDSFSAWRVEGRNETQLLMCPVDARTRSWFMVEAQGPNTRLFFGSAVVPAGGGKGLGAVFDMLSGVHDFYSRALLASAVRRLGA